MKYKQLTLEQRYQLSVLLKSGMSRRRIAIALCVHESTVSRELRRNLGKIGYRPKQAHDIALVRRHRSAKAVKWTRELERLVVDRLKRQWSPDQISHALGRDGFCISGERIYQFVRADRLAGGRLWRNLRFGHKKYKRRFGPKARRGQIRHRVGIEKRPKIADRRVAHRMRNNDITLAFSLLCPQSFGF